MLTGERALIDASWRAANYLSVGQIYLYDIPLLTEPLVKDHVKPRLLGHWGTTPGPSKPCVTRRPTMVAASSSPTAIASRMALISGTG